MPILTSSQQALVGNSAPAPVVGVVALLLMVAIVAVVLFTIWRDR